LQLARRILIRRKTEKRDDVVTLLRKLKADFVNLTRGVFQTIIFRKRYSAQPDFWREYRKEVHETTVVRTRALIAIGVIVYFSCCVIDKIKYPQMASTLLSLRLIVSTINLSVFAVSFTSRGRRYISGLFFFSVLMADLSSSYMAAITDGFSALYYVGNIILTVGVLMFVPWSPLRSVTYVILTVVGYVTLNLAYHPFTPEAMSPITFLACLIPLSYFATLLSEATRIQQLAIRFEIAEANLKLRELDEAKARFFANISHELRTPLTLILGPMERAAKTKENPSTEFWESMIANARRLLRQVNVLLDIAKVDGGKMQCNLRNENLGVICKTLVAAARPSLAERQIAIETLGLDDVKNSVFDSEKIETVVANLLSNAIKFTPANGRISVLIASSGPEHLRVSVQDSGKGIAKDNLDSLFQRFVQLDNSHSRSAKGTGLGLFISKQFVELHGGKIWVESELGVGSKFIFELPILPGQVSSEGPPSAGASQGSQHLTLLADVQTIEGQEGGNEDLPAANTRAFDQRSPEKAVIVYCDDNRDLRSFVKKILDPYYTVLLAADGEMGLIEIKKFQPDLIISDLMMPKMTGSELVSAIRADPELRSTPVVLLTARSSNDSRIDNLKLGVDDYLTKPFSEEELLARSANLIKLRMQQQEIKRQLRSAREIQRALLPPLDRKFDTVDLEVLYQPAEELSGDFFDFIQCDDRIYFYLTDVASHGTASAQITYLIKEMFQQIIRNDRQIEIDDLFNQVKESYAAHQLTYDLGLQLGVLFAPSNTLKIMRSNAPNGVINSRDGSQKVIAVAPSDTVSSSPSGNSAPVVNVSTLTLSSGDSVYFFTDGAFEFASANGVPFGQKRLLKALAGCNSASWRDSISATIKTAGGEASTTDDLTIIRLGIR
jgi:signal transduction histidine kinase/CheY-like chemotaxis protein